jgi:hypothetical protein
MEHEGDSPAPRPLEAAEPAVTQAIHVTPDNIVTLAKMFRECADLLAPVVQNIEDALRIDKPWMGDPVSEWARSEFNKYFATGGHTFARIVQAEHDQHKAMTETLVATAQFYGLTEELIAAGFTELTPR